MPVSIHDPASCAETTAGRGRPADAGETPALRFDARRARQKTIDHPGFWACCFVYDTLSTTLPVASRSVIVPPLFDSSIGLAMVTRTELPAASLPESAKRCCCLSAKTQPARSTSCGAVLISVTVSISGSSIEFASAAMMRTDAGDDGGTIGG